MEIYPQSEQRFSPFEFYLHMRKINSIVFDEKNECTLFLVTNWMQHFEINTLEQNYI
jgi:hypothetical protein